MFSFDRYHVSLLMLVLAEPLTANAVDLYVTTFADDYDEVCSLDHCSLREAINAANGLPEARIALQAGDYILQRPQLPSRNEWPIQEKDNKHGDLDVTGDLLLIGQGAGVTRIDARQIDRIMELHPEGQAQLRNLTVTGGMQMLNGGGILNHGELRLYQVEVRGNRVNVELPYPADWAGAGGGVANFGQLNVQRSTFIGNRVYTGESWRMGTGGAIYNEGTLRVRDSLLSGNMAADWHEVGQGGGIYNEGTADVARTSFLGNSVSRSGMGAAVHNVGQFKLANSTLGNNRSTERAAFENGHAWSNSLSGKSRAELIHVTIAGNDGWGLSNRGDVLIRNSVIAGNRSSEFGDVRNCINQPGMIGFLARGLLMGTDTRNCIAETYIADQTTFTHHLFDLQENNGSQLYPLRRTSAAIDLGIGSCSSHDQRGLDRPRDGNGDGVANCDLGAFERAHP
ncbi:CSLREA domain-containing protein [Pseudomonas borbori]